MSRVLDTVCGFFAAAWLARLFFSAGDLISPSGLPKLHLRVRHGRCFFVIGSLPAWARQQIVELLDRAEASSAVIKQAKDGRFRFSRSVPEQCRPRIRHLVVSR